MIKLVEEFSTGFREPAISIKYPGKPPSFTTIHNQIISFPLLLVIATNRGLSTDGFQNRFFNLTSTKAMQMQISMHNNLENRRVRDKKCFNFYRTGKFDNEWRYVIHKL